MSYISLESSWGCCLGVVIAFAEVMVMCYLSFLVILII